MEDSIPPHPWSGRNMRWQIEVAHRADAEGNRVDGYVATLSWAQDGETLASAAAEQPADCIAAVAAALTSITARAQLTSNALRGLESLLDASDATDDASDTRP
jgi:sulfur transfer protein SufE